MHSETSKIFLCGNKYDLVQLNTDEDGDEVDTTDIEAFSSQCEAMLSGIFKVSCLSGIGVKEMFDDIANIFSLDVKQTFDSSIIQPSVTPEKNSKCFCKS